MRKALSDRVLHETYRRVAHRYDFQHAILTARSDERGRRLAAEAAVLPGDRTLDCGAGTGSMTLLAAARAGPAGRVVAIDSSHSMLEVARRRLASVRPPCRVDIVLGDMHGLPFPDESFDSAVSAYSMCPIRDPGLGASEMFRITKPGGRIGVAHSADPRAGAAKWLAGAVESVVWRFPAVSLGCRSVSVLPPLLDLGCRILLQRRIGIPLWPFMVFVVERPSRS